METSELTIRPVRAQDRQRVVEITADVWEGHDYIPEVFDEWLRDSSSSFQAAEVDGVMQGLQRIRPLSEGIAWYEGLRVATPFRRRGLARAMLTSAIDEARMRGLREMRLATGNPHAIDLFTSLGFEVAIKSHTWRATRIEGADLPAIPKVEDAPGLLALAQSDPNYPLFSGMEMNGAGARDVDLNRLEELCRDGCVRVGPGKRSMLLLRPDDSDVKRVSFWCGSGGSLQSLLLTLRQEADVDGIDEIHVSVPEGAETHDLETAGYHRPENAWTWSIYRLRL